MKPRGFTERITRLARRVAPFRKQPRRKAPDREPPAGPKLAASRGLKRRRPRRESVRHYLTILFWTLVVLCIWEVWNYAVWGWW